MRSWYVDAMAEAIKYMSSNAEPEAGLIGKSTKWTPRIGTSINAARAAFILDSMLFGPPTTALKYIDKIT